MPKTIREKIEDIVKRKGVWEYIDLLNDLEALFNEEIEDYKERAEQLDDIRNI